MILPTFFLSYISYNTDCFYAQKQESNVRVQLLWLAPPRSTRQKGSSRSLLGHSSSTKQPTHGQVAPRAPRGCLAPAPTPEGHLSALKPARDLYSKSPQLLCTTGLEAAPPQTKKQPFSLQSSNSLCLLLICGLTG